MEQFIKMTHEESVNAAAEYLMIATATSLDEQGRLTMVRASPQEAIDDIKLLIEKYKRNFSIGISV